VTIRQICHSFIALGISFALAWAKEPVRPKITGVPHLAVYAKDMEASRKFYREFLGYEEPFQIPGGKMVYFKINDRQYLKLLPETEPNSDRLSHISLETTDVEGMRAYLASRGVSVPAKVEKNEAGNLSIRFKDPEGHTVEFLQFQPGSLTSKAKGKSAPAGRVSQRMMHVGIIVTKLDPEMKFYTDVLGFKEFWRGSSNGTQLSWINMKIPDGEDYIELMLYKESPAPTARGSAHHQCLEVPDIQAALAAVEAKPYRKEYTRPLEVRTGRNRKRQLNLFDPDGTRTELMEPVTVDGVPAPSSTAPPPS
jgi:catechol 2,3-dioxygenase-like lactoylglutathione lyase family enzyme